MAKSHGTDRTGLIFKKVSILIGIITEVVMQILFKMTADELQYWILQKDPLRNQVQTKLSAIFKIADVFVEDREYWRKFYQKHFSLELNFADLVIPKYPLQDRWKLLIIAQGLTLNQVYETMFSLFNIGPYVDGLGDDVVKNVRNTRNAYAVWVRDRAEPDVQYLGHSTNAIDPDMKIGITLLERMIMEIAQFDSSGSPLDIKGATFCSGSRDSNGDVPYVAWFADDRMLSIGYSHNADFSYAKSGIREAVAI